MVTGSLCANLNETLPFSRFDNTGARSAVQVGCQQFVPWDFPCHILRGTLQPNLKENRHSLWPRTSASADQRPRRACAAASGRCHCLGCLSPRHAPLSSRPKLRDALKYFIFLIQTNEVGWGTSLTKWTNMVWSAACLRAVAIE